MPENLLKRTPLYEAHKRLNAKLIDFGGWELPVQYTSIIDEHINTREKAGLFDVSHMGEITVKGAGAALINRLLTNDINRMRPNKVMYSPVTNEEGGVVDDILIYMVSKEEFLLVVNAANTQKDFEWFRDKMKVLDDSVQVTDESEHYAQIAVQGPNAQAVIQTLTAYDLNKLAFFTFDYIELCGARVLISRTGYTGEDGFEIYCRPSEAERLWFDLLNSGAALGIKPVGLGARDTLRLEAALPLYGHELRGDLTPAESGLKAFIKLDKGDFEGKAIIEPHLSNGTKRRLIGVVLEKGIPRDGCRVLNNGVDIGYVTSGAYSPSFKKGIAIALLETEYAAKDTEVEVVVRDKPLKAKIVPLPFYRRNKKS